jgi:hypothetical protein
MLQGCLTIMVRCYIPDRLVHWVHFAVDQKMLVMVNALLPYISILVVLIDFLIVWRPGIM